jgi:hypothetical protein
MRTVLAAMVALAMSSHVSGQNDLRRAMHPSGRAHWPNGLQNAQASAIYYVPVNGQPQQIHPATPFRYNAQLGPGTSLVRPAWQKSQRGTSDALLTPNASLPYLNFVPGPYYFQPSYVRMP